MIAVDYPSRACPSRVCHVRVRVLCFAVAVSAVRLGAFTGTPGSRCVHLHLNIPVADNCVFRVRDWQ